MGGAVGETGVAGIDNPCGVAGQLPHRTDAEHVAHLVNDGVLVLLLIPEEQALAELRNVELHNARKSGGFHRPNPFCE